MKPLDTSKVNVEYRDFTNQYKPVLGRKYTMTHSDETAELFVTIGRRYAMDKVIPIRDEVLLEFRKKDGKLQLFGKVLVDGDGVPGDATMRNAIFLKKLSTSLQAIRYGDRALYENWCQLDDVPIHIWFQSKDPRYNKLYDFGTMKDYTKTWK
ncbi:MAG: hypothetical protein E7256_00500 [Lachnospiraceae bacterium]|nr:hypothetical protein [Lachnospiraceae bacterium]